MSEYIPMWIVNEVSAHMKMQLEEFSKQELSIFEYEYQRARRSPGAILLLAIFFPIQLFLLKKVVLGVIFLLTVGGLLVWWIVEIIKADSRTREYNANEAQSIINSINKSDR